MVETTPKSTILPNPEPLERFKRTSLKYNQKNEYDYADMDDLRKDQPGVKVSLLFDMTDTLQRF